MDSVNVCHGVGGRGVDIGLKGPAALEGGHRMVCGICKGGMGSCDERSG